MKISKVDLYIFMIFLIILTEAGLNPESDNVCLKTIIYNETVTVILQRPASKKDVITCLKEGKHCDEKNTIAAKEPRVITRSKIVTSCCKGYEENLEGTQCAPICAKGCGNGRCIAPEQCTCEAGFYGPECSKICGEGRWGENCIFVCDCSENEECNIITGCMCKPGWMGDRCNAPCPDGYYGVLCEEKCRCDSHPCDHVTGTCIKETETLFINETEEDVRNKTKHFESDENNISSTSKKEIFDEKISEKAVTTEDEGVITQSAEVENTSQPEEPVNVVQNAKKFDVLKGSVNLTILRNELLNTDSDRRMKPVENMQTSHPGNFIPTFTVLSGVTFLIILIAGKWLVLIIQKKIKKMANIELGTDEELSILSYEKLPSLTWENNLENPIYTADILRAVPTLETFKPQTTESEKKKTIDKKVKSTAE